MSLSEERQAEMYRILRPIRWWRFKEGEKISFSIASFLIGPIVFCLLRWPNNFGEWLLALVLGLGFFLGCYALHNTLETKTLNRCVADFDRTFPQKNKKERSAAIQYLYHLAKTDEAANLLAVYFPKPKNTFFFRASAV